MRGGVKRSPPPGKAKEIIKDLIKETKKRLKKES